MAIRTDSLLGEWLQEKYQDAIEYIISHTDLDEYLNGKNKRFLVYENGIYCKKKLNDSNILIRKKEK